MFVGIILFGLLGLACWSMVWRGLMWLLRRLGTPSRSRILLSFLMLGIIMGLFSVWAWPSDFVALLNVFGKLPGDVIHKAALAHYGYPRLDQVPLVVPWLFRLPQLYAIISFLLCGLLGIVAQRIANVIAGKNRENGKDLRETEPAL